MNHKRNLKTPLLGAMMIISMLLLTGCNLGEFGAKNSGDDEAMMEKSEEQVMMKKEESEVMMEGEWTDEEMLKMEKEEEGESMDKMEKEEVMMEKKPYSNGLQSYSQAAFAAAVADGKTVALDFHANWCSVCVGNEPKLKSAIQGLNNSELVVFKADFDTERDLKKEYGIVSQATYVLIKDGKEVNRVSGAQSEEKFKNFLNS